MRFLRRSLRSTLEAMDGAAVVGELFYLTRHGAMEPSRLNESPFTDFNPLGVEGLFKPAEVTELFTVLSHIRARAA